MRPQDVKRVGTNDAGDDANPDADGEVSLKDGLSRGRMASVHDSEMSRSHKSQSRRFDGHKAVVVDTNIQLITGVDVLSGNAPDDLGAPELVEQNEPSADVLVSEAMGDPAYDDGGAHQAFVDAGRKLVARVPGCPNRKHFPKDDFVIDLMALVPAPVRQGRLPVPSYQWESETTARVRPIAAAGLPV